MAEHVKWWQFLVAVNTHQCSRKGNGALILEEPEAGWKEGNATLIYWVSIRGNEALAVFFSPKYLQGGMNLAFCMGWIYLRIDAACGIFFFFCRQSRIHGRLDEWSELESKQLPCGVRHLYLGNWVLRLGVWDPSRVARKGCEYFFQPLENTPFLACRQHHSWPASLQGAFGAVCVQILSRICGCPLFSDEFHRLQEENEKIGATGFFFFSLWLEQSDLFNGLNKH